MKNLTISSKTEFPIDSKAGIQLDLSDQGPISYFDGKLFLHEHEETKILADFGSVFQEEGSSKESEICSGICFFVDGRTVLAFESGLLLCHDPSSSIEVIGTFPSGLQSLTKSPDDEILTLLSKDGAVILMTSRDFDPLLEFNLDQVKEDAALGNVNVGWGAKETQFHGKAGKAAREIEQERPEALQKGEDSRAKLVWRDDGQYFAVSYVSQIDQIRRIRVFDRQGQLQSTSEPVKHLGSSLAWKPLQGALIASSLKLPNGSDVIGFFEKNGLRHGEFLLNQNGKVHHLAWNSDASILAVHLEDIDQQKHFVQLWTVSNYKWQLKKSWNFDKTFHTFVWDPMSPLTLYLFAENGSKVELKWKIHQSQGKTSEDLSMIGVIDSNVLKVTPFRQMIVPPPISAYEIHLEAKISDVIFPTFEPSNQVLVVTEDLDILLFDLDGKGEDKSLVKITGAGGNGFVPKCTTLQFVKKLSLEKEEMYNWCWFNQDLALASTGSMIKVINLSSGAIQDSIICEDIIQDIVPSTSSKAIIVLQDGTLLELNSSLEITPNSFNLDVRKFSKIEVVQDFVIALDERSQRLYINGQEVGSGINSFAIHSHFLMATTVKHSLKCLPLKSLPRFASDDFWINESVRSLERGSKLVSVVPFDTKTILQMPRGNLEVIHPRALSLHILKQFLDDCKYKETFEMLRKQRINLNLVVDHNPKLFKENVGKVIQEIANVDRLCVFIADLLEEDVTTTMYESMYKTEQRQAFKLQSKIDEVCQMLLEAMSSNKELYILPIISCHVKSSKSKIDNALLEIKSLKDQGKSAKADEALSFLLLLVPVNQLFDVALGLYDFDLVLFVAEKSQKDPKEFLPFLNDLKKIQDEHYRKFKIDFHLKRFSSALVNISNCPDNLDECLSLVKNQRLYLEAMELFKTKKEAFKEICNAYGDYLLGKKYFEDAALVYEAGELKIEAVSAWEQAGQWTYCLALAKNVIKIPNEYTSLCKRLVEKLKETNRHREASRLLVEHLNDPEEALVVLLEGQAWDEALHLIHFHQRLDLLETNFKPMINEAAEETLANLDKKINTFENYVQRFSHVIQMKEKLAEGNFEETDINLEDADMYSDVTSLAGGQSIHSRMKSNPGSIKTRISNKTKSSRSKRKQELKKYSTKEGSKYEELGLMAALHDFMTQAYKSTFSEVGLIIRALVKLGQKDKAKSIQEKASKLQSEMAKNETVIWNPKWSCFQDENSAVKFGPQSTTEDVVKNVANQENTFVPEFSLLEPKYRIPPQKVGVNDWMLQMLM